MEYCENGELFNYIVEKGHLSEWKMREKLYAKEATKSQVDSIIKRLDDMPAVLQRIRGHQRLRNSLC